MNAVDLLSQFGLTKQESLIYLTLLAEENGTGYEIAKQTGISRSNVYTSLAGLLDKGAVNLIEGAAARYATVPPAEFCENRLRELRQCKQDLLACLPAKTTEVDGYITIGGKRQIIHKMKNMILAAGERIYVAVSGEIMKLIHAELNAAVSKGVRLVVITDETPALDGATVYIAQIPRRQIRLITDSACVLTGDIGDGEDSTCLFSKKKNLVDLFKDALKNEIRLIDYERGRERE